MSFTKMLTKLANFPSDKMELNGDGGRAGGTGSKNLNEMMMAPGKKTPSNKAVNGRRRFGENGFEEGGGYMAVKKAKLDNQFNVSTRGLYNKDDSIDSAEIFKGVSIYINGYTNPPEPELREIFILHGGTFHPYNSSKTTYVVATNLSAPSKRLYGAKTITPDWIMDSIAAGKKLDTRKYMLYNFNQEKNQKTLTQIMQSKKSPVEIPAPQFKDVANSPSCTITNGSNGHDNDEKEKVSESEEEDEFFECSQETPDRKAKVSSVPIPKSNGTVNSDENDIFEKSFDDGEVDSVEDIVELPSSNESVKVCTPPPQKEPDVSAASIRVSPSSNKGGIKTANDEGFLEDFFGRSRLHLISEQKKEMQLYIANLKKNVDSHAFENLKTFEAEFGNDNSSAGMSLASNEVILMHVDMDCFFVSVGLLSRPHLRGKPVIVTHSSGKGQESRSDVACASYEARKFGVRNGMWVGEAKSMCPELEVIPYDFEEYKRVSKLFYEAVASVTLDLEACSVDEMVIDATSILRKVPGASPEDLAGFLRRIIKTNTNCPASIGIGSNRLLAKLAVKLAKPDGIHQLKDIDAPAYIQGLQVRDLPGVGWSNEGKLRELNVVTCGDLLKVPPKDLRSVFGEKTAEKLFNLCKGKDTAEIKTGLDRPKSLSVDVNFGIRFTKEDEITQFLMKICKELSTRAERVQAVSTHFTLKLLIRKKGAGDPLKQGGHGIVDSMTRSRTLINPTRSWHEFYKTAISLSRLMRVPPTDYRGVGVTLTDLTFDSDKGNKKSVQRTLTDMPISRAQKMLSIISQKKSRNSITESVTSEKSSISSSQSSDESGSTIPQSPEILDTNSSIAPVPDNNKKSSINKINNTNGIFNADNSRQQNKKDVKNQTEANDLSKLPVDIAVLRQLPRDIAEEQCQMYGISKDLLDAVDSESTAPETGSAAGNSNGGTKVENYYDNVETVDQSFLLALPDSLRQDVLIQLQEAKGRRNVSTAFDDQQPCSSRQALERSRQLELERSKKTEDSDGNLMESSNESPAEQTTPVINYSAQRRPEYKSFWDMSVRYVALPATSSNRPALNNCIEPAEVRNLIREGLTNISDPMPEEVENLEKYFVQLISDGWIEQTEVLIKFIYRQAVQLGKESRWTPHLHQIIARTQECCKKLYHGELEVE